MLIKLLRYVCILFKVPAVAAVWRTIRKNIERQSHRKSSSRAVLAASLILSQIDRAHDIESTVGYCITVIPATNVLHRSEDRAHTLLREKCEFSLIKFFCLWIECCSVIDWICVCFFVWNKCFVSRMVFCMNMFFNDGDKLADKHYASVSV